MSKADRLEMGSGGASAPANEEPIDCPGGAGSGAAIAPGVDRPDWSRPKYRDRIERQYGRRSAEWFDDAMGHYPTLLEVFNQYPEVFDTWWGAIQDWIETAPAGGPKPPHRDVGNQLTLAEIGISKTDGADFFLTLQQRLRKQLGLAPVDNRKKE